MPVSPEGPSGDAPVRRTSDQQSRDSGSPRLRQPRANAGSFTILLIDNTTKRATRVNVKPLTVEGIMRSSLRDRRLASGYLWMQLLEAAKRLWPEFEPEVEHKPLVGYPLPPRRVEDTTEKRPFRPRWRRWLDPEEDDDDGSL